jgi:hypothetical protein
MFESCIPVLLCRTEKAWSEVADDYSYWRVVPEAEYDGGTIERRRGQAPAQVWLLPKAGSMIYPDERRAPNYRVADVFVFR